MAPSTRKLASRSDGTRAQYKAEPYVFRRLVNGEAELMVGVHVDDIIVCGEKDDCNKFLDELRHRFPIKNKGA